MFVLYVCADVTFDYEIMARNRPVTLSIVFSNESVWMVLGTVNPDG
jgi:hypothetical protein